MLVQEFANFTDHLILKNAEHIGYDISSSNALSEKLNDTSGALKWPQSIPMVCANKPLNNMESECHRNKISPDGLHWCVETLGPRYTASISCLLGCVYNERIPESSPDGLRSLQKCEQDCNEQFMSLKPIDETWLGSERTLFSKARHSS